MKLTPEVLTAALEGLQARRARLERQIAEVRRRLGTRRGRPPKRVAEGLAPARRKRRKLSAAARKRMSDAQKKRWAAVRATKTDKRKRKTVEAA